MPSTVERTLSGTARAATDIAAAVQASEPPKDARTNHDAKQKMRGRQQHEPREIEHGAEHHDGTEAKAHGEAARERLQQSPSEILHGNRQRELGDAKSQHRGSKAAGKCRAIDEAPR
jgi:hypothetical protein